MPESVRVEIEGLQEQLSHVLAGKSETIRYALVAMLSGGHLLIEDLPGMGKTTLAQGLAASFSTDFGRIQFTSDILPADIIGVEIFDPSEKTFIFHPGPIFHHIVLADEINRATPRAQSALLEAMAEGQVSVERETRKLPEPFFVVATQNPLEHRGTFPLPESQLDRFFMRISIGYPDREAERKVLLDEAGRSQIESIVATSSLHTLEKARSFVRNMPVSEVLLDYLLQLLEKSRDGEWLKHGISPRAGRDILAAARAKAWLDGREYVSAADLQWGWLPCLAHRVEANGPTEVALSQLLEQVPVPG
jgi:MoxR-like ATPase